ncbi:hypothetical protein [Streptomyces celluloflavus]|uniref:hypothetical protein n=1 Tax=Streptomyces celluloflavus TaxID=58344 RepID=UPI0036C80F6F
MPEGNARAAYIAWRPPDRVPTEFAEPTRPLLVRAERALRRMLVAPAVVIDPTGRPPPGPDLCSICARDGVSSDRAVPPHDGGNPVLTEEPQSRDDWRRITKEVREARDGLAAALRDAGVILPSLTTDIATCAGRTIALVDLGRCNVETAHRLANALREVSRRGAP